MDFLRKLTNNEELILDEDLEKFLDELASLEDPQTLDEDAWNRIEARVEARDLAMYRFLVEPKNLILIKSFIELSRKGRTIPSPMVKAYDPIVEMIDDIVTAGPSFVQLLKVLHSRAKRSK